MQSVSCMQPGSRMRIVQWNLHLTFLRRCLAFQHAAARLAPPSPAFSASSIIEPPAPRVAALAAASTNLVTFRHTQTTVRTRAERKAQAAGTKPRAGTAHMARSPRPMSLLRCKRGLSGCMPERARRSHVCRFSAAGMLRLYAMPVTAGAGLASASGADLLSACVRRGSDGA